MNTGYNSMTEDKQLAAVQEVGYAVEYIKKPSEGVQLAAVKRYCYTIRFIANPSEAVQLEALRNNWNKDSLHKNFNNTAFLSSHDFLLLKLRFGELK